jgi:hypothetical protein
MNGSIGVIVLVDSHVIQTMSFEIVEDRVRTIYIVRNPEKLKRVEDQMRQASRSGGKKL